MHVGDLCFNTAAQHEAIHVRGMSMDWYQVREKVDPPSGSSDDLLTGYGYPHYCVWLMQTNGATWIYSLHLTSNSKIKLPM